MQVLGQRNEVVVATLLHPESLERRWLEADSAISPALPPDFVDAVLASQDDSYWNHGGFDTRKAIEGIIDILRGGEEVNLYRSIPQRLAYMTILPGEDFSRPLISRYLRSLGLRTALGNSD